MRSAQGLASSVVVGPIVATTQPPAGTDPAKPIKLPGNRQWVGAKFIAASNSLGVDGSKVKVGVGVLPKIVFTTNIRDKKTVEENLIVSAQVPGGKLVPVEGAWGWVSDSSAVFRPKKYWPGKSVIRVASFLGRTILGSNGSKSLIGLAKLNTTYSFQTARTFIAKVDGKTRQMKVYVDGAKVQTFKVSLGKNEWETRNGTKVISTAKEEDKTYRSESLGLTEPEDQYELDARWNTRLTPTGEFIHAAPWAYGRLGVYNGSHGCTNMFEEDAKWIYDETIPGDVVVYANTGGEVVEPWNGPGGLWNIPWSKWLKKSAKYSGSANVNTDTNEGTGSLADAQPASA
jgi:lipoprotein-anchoring transpeptidase ErfK/SrfK